MPIKNLPVARWGYQVLEAAGEAEWVRVYGAVTERGEGRSGRYRQVWLIIEGVWGRVRVTAGPESTLGGLQPGTAVEIATRLTGMLDLHNDFYVGAHTRLLRATPPR